MAGLPPTTLSGQYGTAKTTFNFKTPNVQSTVTSAGGLIETGNKNLLANPSFESSTVASNWTNTGGGTPTASTTNLQDGLKSVSTTSTGAWTFSQEPTLYATSKSGQEAEASIWVYSATASADMWLCPKINGVSVTASVANGCVQYTNLGSPQKLTVFMLFGSSSTGLEVKGSGAITYILDDAYLGDRRPSVLGVTTTPSKTVNGSFTGFGTVTPSTNNCKYTRTANWMHGDCYFQAGTTAASLGGVTIPDSLTLDSSKIIATGTTASVGQRVGHFSGNVGGQSGYLLANPGSSTTLLYIGNTISSSAITPTNVSTVLTNNSNISLTFDVPILEWAGDTNSNTTRCDDPRQCDTVFSAQISSAGVVSAQSTGTSFPWISGSCVVSNTAQYDCPITTGLSTLTMTCTGISIDTAFSGINIKQDVANSSNTNLRIRSVATSTGSAFANAFTLFCQKNGIDYINSRITQQIVQSRGVANTPGAGKIEHFKVFYSGATSTSVCNSTPCTIAQLGNAVTSVTWASAALYSMNLPKTYTSLMCTFSVQNGVNAAVTADSGYAGGTHTPYCTNCNSLVFDTGNAGGPLNSYGTIDCDGIPQ